MTIDLAGHRNLGDAFGERVASGPDRPALTIYRGSAATEHPTLTAAELHRRARLRAAALSARFTPGDRVLLALPSGPELVELYLACLIAGLVAVPVPVPGSSTVAGERVAAIARDCAPSLAVASGEDREAVAERLRDHGLGEVPVEEPGEVAPGEAAEPPQGAYRPGPDTLGVLQYSSGSTGTPKGVMLTHGDILADIAALAADCGATPGDAFGIWIPLHHDMGLFGMLTTALLSGGHLVMMPPGDFVRRPVEWLRLLGEYGCAFTAAPNFAFDMCTRHIPDAQLEGLDLSGLRVAFNGSEPIHVPTMTAFTKRFATAGLRPDALSPAYGMAEATVYVTVTPPGAVPTVLVVDPRRLEDAEAPELHVTSGGDGREVVGHSAPRPHGVELRIVDPRTGRTLPERAIGEIWLRGPGIGRGYWNQPELSARTFAARRADDDDTAATETPWFRSGDLGALLDGELYVTGRIKELLIVHGRNLFPQDLEQEARAAHPALAGFNGAAFSVPAPDERIVLVHEIDNRLPAEELPVVAAAVIRRLTVAFGVPVRNVVLVRRGGVRRTTSGKIQRAAMREQFLAGGVQALHAELDPGLPRSAQAGAQ
ncbi:fatty acyl-AMP ligase [Kitasatospora aureofaciens]|uniref:fatty acyl-AMP ligase n=1 Tax=Kitasatospora aureofaciens TaxID=1894 RepID=UPI0037C9A3EE